MNDNHPTSEAPPSPWDPKRYGTKDDPVRQSDLNEVAGQYGCSKRFKLRKQAEALGEQAPPGS